MAYKRGRPQQQLPPTLYDFRRMWSIAQLLYKFDDNQDIEMLHAGIQTYCKGWGVEPVIDGDGYDYLRTLARMAAHANEQGQNNWKET